MKTWKMLLILAVAFLLTGCSSPFAPIVVAPASVPVISYPGELPQSLRERSVLWYGGVLRLKKTTGAIEVALPEDACDTRLSWDDRYMTYVSCPLIVGEGLPKRGDSKINILDLQTGEKRELASKEQLFPDALWFESPRLTRDGKSVIFQVAWEHAVDLVKVDMESGAIQRLNVDVLLTSFTPPDVSQDGHIVVICKGPNPDTVSELCLLDENGKFIRHLTSNLTSEGYPVGDVLFTPDGQYVIYESRYKLFKVPIDGSGWQQIAPCGSPLLVTDEHVVAWCYVSQEPDCYGLFVASLDGSDFRRIGYIESYCVSEK